MVEEEAQVHGNKKLSWDQTPDSKVSDFPASKLKKAFNDSQNNMHSLQRN